MALNRFDPPGFLDDLAKPGLQAWSDWISEQLDDARTRDGHEDKLSNYGPRPQFFNALKSPPASDAVEKDISWTAFPRLIAIQSIGDRQRWRTADSSRDVQDEYCEWSIARDAQSDKIKQVTFTSEGPEYWQFLAASAPEKVLELYKTFVHPDVQIADLFEQGTYNPRNKWNSSTANGAMHLVQQNNTLGAEIELAAASTLVRRIGGRVLTAEQELIQCGKYGQAERHSDPHIGAVVNDLARQKAAITLANPVGLCIENLSTAGWQTPDGSDPQDYWRVVRGTKEKALRAVFEVPASKMFVVGDIKINGKNIEFGAQIADFITIKLTGLATRIGITDAPVVEGCVQRSAFSPKEFAPALSVRSVLADAGLGAKHYRR